MPLTLMMACGKDNFSNLFKKTFPREWISRNKITK
jgi:hypothetical protein